MIVGGRSETGFVTWFACPYLGHDVELTAEREDHITGRHPDLLPRHLPEVAETPADPDVVFRSTQTGTLRTFAR